MKKLLRNTALIAVFYFIIVLVNACCNCRDYQKPWYFTIEAINTLNTEFQIEGDTSIRMLPFSSDSIKKQKFGILIYLEAKRIAAIQNTNPLNFTSAYACKCDIDNQILIDSITEIHVKTLFDFDADHLSGTNVDAYFNHLQTTYDSTKIHIEYLPLNKILYDKRPQQSINLYLLKNPTLNQNVQFELLLKTAKGKTYYDTTASVILY